MSGVVLTRDVLWGIHVRNFCTWHVRSRDAPRRHPVRNGRPHPLRGAEVSVLGNLCRPKLATKGVRQTTLALAPRKRPAQKDYKTQRFFNSTLWSPQNCARDGRHAHKSLMTSAAHRPKRECAQDSGHGNIPKWRRFCISKPLLFNWRPCVPSDTQRSTRRAVPKARMRRRGFVLFQN